MEFSRGDFSFVPRGSPSLSGVTDPSRTPSKVFRDGFGLGSVGGGGEGWRPTHVPGPTSEPGRRLPRHWNFLVKGTIVLPRRTTCEGRTSQDPRSVGRQGWSDSERHRAVRPSRTGGKQHRDPRRSDPPGRTGTSVSFGEGPLGHEWWRPKTDRGTAVSGQAPVRFWRHELTLGAPNRSFVGSTRPPASGDLPPPRLVHTYAPLVYTFVQVHTRTHTYVWLQSSRCTP